MARTGNILARAFRTQGRCVSSDKVSPYERNQDELRNAKHWPVRNRETVPEDRAYSQQNDLQDGAIQPSIPQPVGRQELHGADCDEDKPCNGQPDDLFHSSKTELPY